MIFLPENETIMLYTEDKAEFMEAALTKMRGTYPGWPLQNPPPVATPKSPTWETDFGIGWWITA